jgi:hypothetical protein
MHTNFWGGKIDKKYFYLFLIFYLNVIKCLILPLFTVIREDYAWAPCQVYQASCQPLVASDGYMDQIVPQVLDQVILLYRHSDTQQFHLAHNPSHL